ncbi:NHL domain-containing protein [Paludibaculum fermentans]|uniref:Teneurin NHL domain-containing protein n=1 Tax=Paludibaculum fermentans TaxID=1473598 RepID=A0A7S7NSK0_PALFE|nr:hypothetical protein [Paludibaculum fermentans]QOY88909.1 hypothetical protein IRI77_02805 [Paludibaculum fermentans]
MLAALACFSIALSAQYREGYVVSRFAGGSTLQTGALTPLSLYLEQPYDLAFTPDGALLIADTRLARLFRIGADGTVTVLRPKATMGGVAVHPDGSIYYSAYGQNMIYRLNEDGTETLIAGTGKTTPVADNVPALEATVKGPSGLVFDTAGNLYIAEKGASRIRRMSAEGTMTTVAGTSGSTYGENVPGTSGQVISPEQLALDSAGRLYISSSNSSRIRVLDTKSGLLSTFAGGGSESYGKEGIAPTNATLSYPYGVAASSSGAVYISESYGARVRNVAAGRLMTFAGTGVRGYSGDGGSAQAAQVSYPTHLTVGPEGALYFIDNRLIRRVDTDGVITTFAGTTDLTYMGGTGMAMNARLITARGLSFDANDNLFLADSDHHMIRRITQAGEISTVAGNSIPGSGGNGGAATEGSLFFPWATSHDAQGNLYVAQRGDSVEAYDADASLIRMVSAESTLSIAGGGGNASGSTAAAIGDGGPAVKATFIWPESVTTDAAGQLYIADTNHSRIRRVDASGNITTVAGNGNYGYTGDNGAAVSAQLARPNRLCMTPDGGLVISDADNYRIRKVDAQGIIRTIAGTGATSRSGDGGPAISAGLGFLSDIACDKDGSIFLAEYAGYIRRIDPDGVITTVAGASKTTATALESADPSTVAFGTLQSVAVDTKGQLYFSAGTTIYRLLPKTLDAGLVRNAASQLTGPIAPGEIIEVEGPGIGPEEPAAGVVDEFGVLGGEAGGTRVLINSSPAPVVSASSGKVRAIVPLTARVISYIEILRGGVLTNRIQLTQTPSAPGLFAGEDGKGQAQAKNQDGTANAVETPVAVGEVLTLRLTGAGLLDADVAPGAVPADPRPKPVLPVAVLFGEVPADEVVSAELVEPGVVEVKVRVPAAAPVGGQVPVAVQVGGVSTQPEVTVAVAAARPSA